MSMSSTRFRLRIVAALIACLVVAVPAFHIWDTGDGPLATVALLITMLTVIGIVLLLQIWVFWETRGPRTRDSRPLASNDPFIAALERGGFFKGLEPPQIEELKVELCQHGWSGLFAAPHRLFPGDAEDLAEGGVGSFLKSIEPYLAVQGVRLPDVKDDFTDAGYWVQVGRTRHKIYDAAESERDASGNETGLCWALSTARSFQIVNSLLDAAGSPERAYAVNGGNDLFAFFLTPELFRTITTHTDASTADAPYTPSESDHDHPTRR